MLRAIGRTRAPTCAKTARAASGAMLAIAAAPPTTTAPETPASGSSEAARPIADRSATRVESADRGRETWIDLAKTIAIVAVVAEHAAIPLIQPFDAASPGWWTGVTIWASTRFAVPLFVIASGALMLDPGRDESVRHFYGRRVARIGPALVAWSAVYVIFGVVIDGWPSDAGHAAALILGGRPYYHLYFLFAIAGLYLVTPLLRRALAGSASARVAMLAACAFLVGGADAVSRATVGVSATAGAATMFIPYLGYYIAGPLVRRARLSPARAPALAALAIASVAGAIVATAALSGSGQVTAGYALDYLSPFTIAGSLAIALLVGTGARHAAILDGTGARLLLRRAAAMSFGIYLVHPIVLAFLGRIVDVRTVPGPDVVAVTLAALAISASLATALRRTPLVRALA